MRHLVPHRPARELQSRGCVHLIHVTSADAASDAAFPASEVRGDRRSAAAEAL
jgi:hypothetical protein